eukprot:UN12354
MIKTVLAHLKLKPFRVCMKCCPDYLHQLRFFNTKPPAYCKLQRTCKNRQRHCLCEYILIELNQCYQSFLQRLQ